MRDASVWMMKCSSSEDVIMHVNRLVGAIDVNIREIWIAWTVSFYYPPVPLLKTWSLGPFSPGVWPPLNTGFSVKSISKFVV